jgi:hypothetical protein
LRQFPWYIKHDYLGFLDGLITHTKYLQIDPISKLEIKQRIYHLVQNINEQLLCKRCNIKQREFKYIRNFETKTLINKYKTFLFGDQWKQNIINS